MTDQSYQFPKFFVTAPQPCPYLEGREERKVFTDLTGPDAEELNESLGKVGFRRSQSVAYRPACEGCNACKSVRVLAGEFRPSKSQRRIWRMNADLKSATMDAFATAEQYGLIQKYLSRRHPEGGMSEMSEFEYMEMIEATPVPTNVIEYRLPHPEDPMAQGRLVATALTDVLSDGLSMIYSFFDPAESRRSLGNYMILDHIERAARAGLPHVYLGFWVKGSRKMAYKNRFRPFELLDATGWKRQD